MIKRKAIKGGFERIDVGSGLQLWVSLKGDLQFQVGMEYKSFLAGFLEIFFILGHISIFFVVDIKSLVKNLKKITILLLPIDFN